MEPGTRLEWEKLPTEELVEELRFAGLSLPAGLTGEILRRGKDAVPVLSALAGDAGAWESADPDERWGPVHALHVLGAIGDPSAAGAIVDALRLSPEPDEIIENTPTILGHLGPQAIPDLARFIVDEGAEGLMRAVACDGLASIAVLHPQTRAPIVAFLRQYVVEGGQHDPDALTGAIMALVVLRDRASLPAIAQAFRSKQVDEDLMVFEDARDVIITPETVSTDWHYTGDPMEYFSDENMERLRAKMKRRAERRAVSAPAPEGNSGDE